MVAYVQRDFAQIIEFIKFAHALLFYLTTAVFSNRGPHFYINMASGNNTEEIDLNESCFGKVVEGQDVLDDVMDAHLKTRSLSMLGIASIRLEKPPAEE